MRTGRKEGQGDCCLTAQLRSKYSERIRIGTRFAGASAAASERPHRKTHTMGSAMRSLLSSCRTGFRALLRAGESKRKARSERKQEKVAERDWLRKKKMCHRRWKTSSLLDRERFHRCGKR